MYLSKYRIHILVFFLTIFTLKVFVSALPRFNVLDATSLKYMALNMENEHSAEGDLKSSLKYLDLKYGFTHYNFVFIPYLLGFGCKNSWFDHFKRYVNSFHPSVPTPPPNLFVV